MQRALCSNRVRQQRTRQTGILFGAITSAFASGVYADNSGNLNNLVATLASDASVKLTASPAADPGLTPMVAAYDSGKPYLEYDPRSGDISYHANGYFATVVEVCLHSDAGIFRFNNFNPSPNSVADAHTIDILSSNGVTGITLYDFGNILPTGLFADLDLVPIFAPYNAFDDPDGYGPSGIYIVSSGAERFFDILPMGPEPSGLAFISVATIGLLSRKRRQ